MKSENMIKIEMTVDEAKAQLEQFPEDSGKRLIGDHLATLILGNHLTPAQAQAVLVLAWNKVLNTAKLTFPDSTEIYNVRQINTDSVKASFRERDKLGILGCIFREMWEVTDPPYGTALLTPQEQFAKLDSLWQEAAGIMSAETYTDKKQPNVEFTHTRGKENEKRA